MIIDKATSDSLLVSSLVVVTNSGKPIKNLSSFNTETLLATPSSGDPVTAGGFSFEVSNEADFAALVKLIQQAYPSGVEELPDGSTVTVYQQHDPRFLVSMKRKFFGKKGMVDSDTKPDDTFVIQDTLTPVRVECSNCGKSFLIHFGRNNTAWSAKLANIDDNFQTMSEVDLNDLVCDNCDVYVSLYEPS
jgi:hypothetical protein